MMGDGLVGTGRGGDDATPNGPSIVGLSTLSDAKVEKRPKHSMDDAPAESPDNPLLQCVPGMVFKFVVDRDGRSRFPFVSNYCDVIFNVSAGQIKANPDVLLEKIISADRHSFQSSLLQSMSTRKIWDWKGRIEVPNSQTTRLVHFCSNTPPFRNNDTGSTEWNGVVFDVSGKSDEFTCHVRSILDNAPHPIIALDLNGMVTEWNKTAEHVTGYTKFEVLGRNFVSDFVMEAWHSDLLQLLNKVAERDDAGSVSTEDIAATNHDDGKKPGRGSSPMNTNLDGDDMSCEATLRTKGGHPLVHLLLTASAKRDSVDSKRNTGVILIAQDASQRHAALALHRSDAEKGITEWLSHEVRNPLSVAVEASRTLKEDPSDDPEENSNNLELICLSLGYIVELLTDMLDLNKCVEGKIKMNPSPCYLREDILLPTKRMLDQRRKTVDLIIDEGEEILAYVDRLRLQQVLTNLIVNSMKFTSVGFIRVSLRKIRKEEEGGAHLECATGQQTKWGIPGQNGERQDKQQQSDFDLGMSLKCRGGKIRTSDDNGATHISGLHDGTVTNSALSGQSLPVGETKASRTGTASISEAPSSVSSISALGLSPAPPLNLADSERSTNDEQQQSQQPQHSQLQNGQISEVEGCSGILITVSDSGSGIDPSNYPNLFHRWERLGSKTNGTGIGLCLCRSLMDVMGGRIFLSNSYHSGLEEHPGCQFCIMLPPSALKIPDHFYVDVNGAESLLLRSEASSVDGTFNFSTDALSKRLGRDTSSGGASDNKENSADSGASGMISIGDMQVAASAKSASSDGFSGDGRPPLRRSVSGANAAENGKAVYSFPEDRGSDSAGTVGSSSKATSKHGERGGKNVLVGPASNDRNCVSKPPLSSSKMRDPFHNTCMQGKFRILVVDDDTTFRIMFCRRLRRIMPSAIVDESPSGEDAVDKAKSTVYDLITMDHFMALDGMNGAETIGALRANKVDACIIGISGNTKAAHHVEAGADDFVRKPVPLDRKLLRRLASKMSPPANWKVLIADDCKLNLKFMHRKLEKVSSPHYTTRKDAEKRWEFTLAVNGEDSVRHLKEGWFDLVVLDQHMGPGLKGTDVAEFVRTGSMNTQAIVVINTGQEGKLHSRADSGDEEGSAYEEPFNFQWTKPAPSIERIRQDLCLELIEERAPSHASLTMSVTSQQQQSDSTLSEGADGSDGADTSCSAGDSPKKGTNGDGCASSLLAMSVNSGDENDDEDSLNEAEVENIHAGDKKKTILSHDTSMLQKLFDEIGDEATFHDMCSLFITNVPAQLNTIQQLIDENDWSKLATVLHTLKGTLQVFHLDWISLIKPMNDLCLRLKIDDQKGANAASSCKKATEEDQQQMREFAEQQRLALGEVIGVCHGVLSERDGEQDVTPQPLAPT